MTERVRVTGPPRHTAASRTATRLGDVTEQTALGDLYLRSLLAEQLRLALRVIGLLVVTLGLVPLLFHLAPSLADRQLLGIPLAWLALGVLVYPFLLLLGWRYVRRAERNERVFADLVSGHEDSAEDRDDERA
ncbi:hypothetical protein [Nocardioides sp. GCM10030258]|uniref:hypothetical protein n=1 Tax=unclassified Nocardioides TaxID=2615069 RepID=UPI00360D2486